VNIVNEAAMQRRDDAQKRVRVNGAGLDVRDLPSFGFSHRSLMWWGTFGLIAIESTAFALAIVMYFYLRSHVEVWPLTTPPPALLWGSVNTVILLASMWPNRAAKQAAEKLDLAGVQRSLLGCCLFSAAFLAVRAVEFASLNVRWDTDAYGSIVWLLLGLHTTHIATDAWDTLVLTALMHTNRIEGKRYVDVSENSLYWYFVVLSWIPIYGVIYWAPRLH
jgi:heme/copper-type cytochrome/quinol oxidase subunit 3